MAITVTKTPTRVGGGIFSGSINTGEVTVNRGGLYPKAYYSGVGVDTQIWSGGGRLNTFQLLNKASGAAIIFYDGVPATSGGPFATSGHNALYKWFQPDIGAVSGAQSAYVPYGQPVQVDMPFLSGLIVAVVASGCPGFAISYTPDNAG